MRKLLLYHDICGALVFGTHGQVIQWHLLAHPELLYNMLRLGASCMCARGLTRQVLKCVLYFTTMM